MSSRGLVPSRALTDWLYHRASQKRIPLSGTFELSPVCNFSCRMCYVRKTQKEVDSSVRGILSLEDWRRIAREARDAGMLYLLLTGGEPLLWPDFWTLYEELVDMGFLVSINTNGSLIDEAAVARFRKRPPQKISITLYGSGNETYRQLCGIDGVFTKVDWAIRSLRDAGIEVKLNCSLTPDNVADLPWLTEYAKRNELYLSVVTYMFPPIRRAPDMVGRNRRFTPEEAALWQLEALRLDRGEAHFQWHLNRMRAGSMEPLGLDEGCEDPVDGKIRCRAGTASCWITWDGWLTPCGMMPEPKIDLKRQGFADAWSMLVETAEALQLSGVCDKCENRKICHTCAAVAYAETGSFSGIPTYKCQMTVELCRLAQAARPSDEKMEIPAMWRKDNL